MDFYTFECGVNLIYVMKRILIILFLLTAGCFKTEAQTNVYFPFPDSNAVWGQHHQSSTSTGNYLYGLFGDTIINSLRYNKVYSHSESMSIWDTVITSVNAQMIGGIREDSAKRIWFYSFVSDAFIYQDSVYFLYEFSKAVGDTIFVPAPGYSFAFNYLVVDSIDSVLVNNRYRKQFHLGMETWIEGIGSKRDLLSAILPIPVCFCINATTCFKQNDTLYYLNPAYSSCYPGNGAGLHGMMRHGNILVYPNPAIDYFVVETNSSDRQTAELYDISGKQIFIKKFNGNCTIRTADFDEGIYTLTVRYADHIDHQKVIIVH